MRPGRAGRRCTTRSATSTTRSSSRSWPESRRSSSVDSAGDALPRTPRADGEIENASVHSRPVSGIPLIDVKAQYAPLLPRLREAIDGVLESGNFILGPNVAAFEAEAAAFLGVPATIGVANGTDALVLALDAMGVRAGDEV